MQSLQPEESPPPKKYKNIYKHFQILMIRSTGKKKNQILEVFMKIQIQSHSGRMKITVSVSMN